MVTEEDYELLDFGGGRKLERFRKRVLDRPSPPAEGVRKSLSAAQWEKADAVFERNVGLYGKWRFRSGTLPPWRINFSLPRLFRMELRLTDVGHLGVFPEQAENWRWIFEQAEKCLKCRGTLRVLNLFAYTGGSTLAAAAAVESCLDASAAVAPENMFVTHVDAARNVVQRARLNAEISGLEAMPVRWVVEDALKFTQREARRGRVYDAVILDPPSYGHGRGAEVWKIERDLPRLLESCTEITRRLPAFFLLTAHSEAFPHVRLKTLLADYFPEIKDRLTSGPMTLRTSDGRTLPSGEMARFSM